MKPCLYIQTTTVEVKGVMFHICLFLFQINPAMAKRSAVVVLVFVSCCVYLSMSIEVKRSRLISIAGKTTCTSRGDKDIMKECLERYKLGFDNLGRNTTTDQPGHDPPSCAVDLVSFHLVNHFEFWVAF